MKLVYFNILLLFFLLIFSSKILLANVEIENSIFLQKKELGTNKNNFKKIENDSILSSGNFLRVGLKMSPPFTMKNENGRYIGISVELWEAIAQNLNVTSKYVEYDLKNLLIAVENGDIDVCISPLTVTPERLVKFDFTQPFYTSSIAIAVKGKQKSFIMLLISNIFTLNFFKAILALMGVIFVLGLIFWLVERNKNPTVATGTRGIGDGIWWSAVTMATVGYGDKTPITPLGRVIGIFWIFLSIIIISSLTASITTALTMDRIHMSIEKLQDLSKVKTATVEGSSTEAFFGQRGIKIKGLKSIEEGLEMLKNEQIEAFAYDEPILNFAIEQNGLKGEIKIIQQNINNQYYSFSLPRNHPLLLKINPLLIRELESIYWKKILQQYGLEME